MGNPMFEKDSNGGIHGAVNDSVRGGAHNVVYKAAVSEATQLGDGVGIEGDVGVSLAVGNANNVQGGASMLDDTFQWSCNARGRLGGLGNTKKQLVNDAKCVGDECGGANRLSHSGCNPNNSGDGGHEPSKDTDLGAKIYEGEVTLFSL
ncbi:unnamed protein product [Ilex paraguariensis]|uniref:Uncharacterized protein n=1 Tax=Ilex paraguariensis TaxID=185542 RepID=A0ABC8R946_9AQUA